MQIEPGGSIVSLLGVVIFALAIAGVVLLAIFAGRMILGGGRRSYSEEEARVLEEIPLPKLSPFAVISFLFALLALMAGFAAWLVAWIGESSIILMIPDELRAPLGLGAQVTMLSSILPAAIAVVFALVGALHVGDRPGARRGRGFCAVAVLVALLIGLLGFAGDSSIHARAARLQGPSEVAPER